MRRLADVLNAGTNILLRLPGPRIERSEVQRDETSPLEILRDGVERIWLLQNLGREILAVTPGFEAKLLRPPVLSQ